MGASLANPIAEPQPDEAKDGHRLELIDDAGKRQPQAPSQSQSPAHRLSRATKRGLDMFIALALLIVMAPVLLLVILLIELESPGSPFYRARRIGYRGRPLDVLKFRKMPHDAKGLPLTLAGDARLTRIGAFMTSTRVDELPQLWNVLRGQMSLVGPRPEDPRFVALHAEDYDRVLQVRPGITGWSQLAFAAESTILDQSDPVGHYVDAILPAKVRLDCMYAERPRLRSDIATMAWTVLAMLLNVEVAVNRESGRMRRRRRKPGPATAPVAAQT